jgi:dTDP-4-dehydrorhamnose reductase
MRVLVTGREGQLARSLLERSLLRTNIQISTLGRPKLDLEIRGNVSRLVADASPNVVINAAAYTAVDQAEDEPDRVFRINADAAAEVAAAAADIGARLIQISTDYVFGGGDDEPYDEEAEPNPLNVYGRSKLAGEEQVRSANANHLILRSAWIYSPFGRNFVKTVMRAGEQRDVLTVVNDQRGNPTSALDLADGILTVLEDWAKGNRTGLGHCYHLAGAGETSWFDVAEHIVAECRRLGCPAARVKAIPTAEWPTKARRPRNSSLDCRKFERDFGYRAPDWRLSMIGVVRRLARHAQPLR